MNSGCTACLGLSGQSVTCRFVIILYGGRAPQTFHTLPRTLVSANCASACGGDDTHFLCCIEVLLDGAEEVAEAVNCVKGTSIQCKRLCKPGRARQPLIRYSKARFVTASAYSRGIHVIGKNVFVLHVRASRDRR